MAQGNNMTAMCSQQTSNVHRHSWWEFTHSWWEFSAPSSISGPSRQYFLSPF